MDFSLRPDVGWMVNVDKATWKIEFAHFLVDYGVLTWISGIPLFNHGLRWCKAPFKHSTSAGSAAWHCFMYGAAEKNSESSINFYGTSDMKIKNSAVFQHKK